MPISKVNLEYLTLLNIINNFHKSKTYLGIAYNTSCLISYNVSFFLRSFPESDYFQVSLTE